MSQKPGKQKQVFEPAPEAADNTEVNELKAQMAEIRQMLQAQAQASATQTSAHPQNQAGVSQMQQQPAQPAYQAQPVPQQPTQPQIQQIPALQGVSTYVAIHPSGLGVQTYLFDVSLGQWRVPTPHESENMVQLFGIPKNIIDAMKNFRL